MHLGGVSQLSVTPSSNPPYGKSWKTDLERLGGKDGIETSRFCSAVARQTRFYEGLGRTRRVIRG